MAKMKIIYKEEEKDSKDGIVALQKNNCIILIQRTFGEAKTVITNKKTLETIVKSFEK